MHNKAAGAQWRKSHRERLHFLANDQTNSYQDVLSPVGATGAAELSRSSLKELGDYYMDVKLSGGNWQCDWGDGTCQEMEDEIEFADKDNAERSNDFKYVFDVGYFPLYCNAADLNRQTAMLGARDSRD